MRAPVAEELMTQDYAAEAAKIVRSCVHCGFCNATCPTYQLTGDELEGPRGRIYLIKSLLEEGSAGADTRRHLDQCLLCRNCETTCPSGVRYGKLVELVRPEINTAVPWPWPARLRRWLIANVVPYRMRLAPLVTLGRIARPLLPHTLAAKIRPRTPPAPPSTASRPRRVLVLGGCAQPLLAPGIDTAAARVFERTGITLIKVPASGCCGALSLHLGKREAALSFARANIDAWWPLIEAGAEAVIATSSGCGVQLKDYASLFSDDPVYAARAATIEALARDPIELLTSAMLAPVLTTAPRTSIAFQAPCTLQHGQKLAGAVERLLAELGWTLLPVNEAHLCCGSAGSYSLLHPATSKALGARKLGNLLAGQPQAIVTANIGCQLHLAGGTRVPVMHWLELLAQALETDSIQAETGRR